MNNISNLIVIRSHKLKFNTDLVYPFRLHFVHDHLS